ncbi:MAG: serine hydrolase, partial [Gaiellaceae bacterium]
LLAHTSGSFRRRDARYLLWLLAHVADHGKLDRNLPGGVSTLHKAGWIRQARHDAGLVYWRGGAYVVAVMTWNSGGVGSRSDVLAGRVARSAYDRFRALRAANVSLADASTT